MQLGPTQELVLEQLATRPKNISELAAEREEGPSRRAYVKACASLVKLGLVTTTHKNGAVTLHLKAKGA